MKTVKQEILWMSRLFDHLVIFTQCLLLDLSPSSLVSTKVLVPLSCVFVSSLKLLSFQHIQISVSLSILSQCLAQRASSLITNVCITLSSFNVDGTLDYVEFTSSNNPLMAFTSDPSTHRQCFEVNIIDDEVLENTERFSLSLGLAQGNIPVIVSPDISEVEILDDDGWSSGFPVILRLADYLSFFFIVILVGFVRNFTGVDEDIGSFELCVAIFTDISLLPTNFEFFLSLITTPGTAGSSIKILLIIK